MEIKIQDFYNKLTYILDIEYRITVIRGDSATGKSTLARYIETKDLIKLNIESPKKIMTINSETMINFVESSKYSDLNPDYIYLMDEESGVDNTKVANIINNSKCTFIIISRDTSLPNINYSIEQIYEFKNSGKYNYLERLYDIDEFNKNKKKSKLNKILTEDSGSGYEFYKQYKNFDVTTSNGNSNIIKNIKNNQIIAIDSLGFGPYIKSLNEILEYSNNFIINPKSFEWLLLNSIGNYDDFELDLNYKNEEEMYFKKLKQILETYKINYSKSHLNKWFLEEPQFRKINNKINEMFKIDLKVLNENLENNLEMEWI